MKKLLLPLLFLTTLSLSAEVIHEQKWDAPFTTKEVIFSSRRLAKVASQEKTPDGDAVLALRVIEKPNNTPHGAQLNLYGNADLKKGDKIKYTTKFGTRTYQVKTVTKINETDYSYLERTSDNRMTLITCVENVPRKRWCVQAVEVK